MDKLKPLGLYFFPGVLVFSSVIFFLGYNYEVYSELFSKLPEKTIFIRFCFSGALRIVMIAIALGVFFHKEIFRKLAILLSIFTITTIYWKHPLFVFQNKEYVQYIELQFMNMSGCTDSCSGDQIVELIPVLAMLLMCTIDVVFYGAMMYYLTRKEVKKYYV